MFEVTGGGQSNFKQVKLDYRLRMKCYSLESLVSSFSIFLFLSSLKKYILRLTAVYCSLTLFVCLGFARPQPETW